MCRPNKGSGSFPLGAGSLQHPAGSNPYRQFFTPIANIVTTRLARSLTRESAILATSDLTAIAVLACSSPTQQS